LLTTLRNENDTKVVVIDFTGRRKKAEGRRQKAKPWNMN
jgi:hypothetical protein